MDKTQAKALKDFAAESEEILENLAEDLEVGREQYEASGKVRPDRLNKIFREMHSLKGLASMLALERITTLSHDLESLLDKIRMGKVKPGGQHFDLLVDSLRTLRHLVMEAADGEEKTEITALLARVSEVQATPSDTEISADRKLLLDEATLNSLTEYEEHRLKENIEEGNNIYAVQVGFDFSDFDVRLRDLSERITEKAEIISTLPVMDPDLQEGIHFRIIVGTSNSQGEIAALVAEADGQVSDLCPVSGEEKIIGPTEEAEPVEESPEGESAEDYAEAESLEEVKGISNTVKVDIEKLDAVMGVLGELNLVRSAIWNQTMELQGREGMDDVAMALVKQIRMMERKLEDLQRSIVDIRMVPIGQIFSRLNRTAKKLARTAGKEVGVHLYGGDTELDKVMMEELISPLVHLIRNSLDHGIESPTERVKAKKSAEGELVISAYQKGNSIIIEVTDDGRGLQWEKIRKVAVTKGLMDEKAAIDPDECLEFIFQPGFSSADEVTEVSGRGVGLDVVKESIEAMKGSIAVWSEPNQGTSFQITMPITLAIIQSLIISCCDESYAIPISSILETLRITEDEIQLVDQREVYDLRGVTLPLLRLEERFWNFRQDRKSDDRVFVVVVRRGEKMAGIVVDDLLGEQETVVHPLGERLSKIPGVAGATEVGENKVILVIDTASLFQGREAVHV